MEKSGRVSKDQIKLALNTYTEKHPDAFRGSSPKAEESLSSIPSESGRASALSLHDYKFNRDNKEDTKKVKGILRIQNKEITEIFYSMNFDRYEDIEKNLFRENEYNSKKALIEFEEFADSTIKEFVESYPEKKLTFIQSPNVYSGIRRLVATKFRDMFEQDNVDKDGSWFVEDPIQRINMLYE